MNPFLLTNPFTNPLASQLLFRQFIMFSVGALALAAVHLWRVKFAGRGDAAQALNPPEKVLWLRYGTWVAIALIFTGASHQYHQKPAWLLWAASASRA